MTTQDLDKTKTSEPDGITVNSAEENKYLTFKLAAEEFGLEILKVREIIGRMDITAVPQMPNYMKGVINLRGRTIPVVDLRLKFGLAEIEHTEQTCIIMVDVGREIGILVDAVSEVLDIADEQIDSPPAMSADGDTSFIAGMGKVGDSVKILLNIEKVMTSDQILEISSGAGGCPEPNRESRKTEEV